LTKTRVEKHGEVWIVYCDGKIWGWTKDRELAERAAKGLRYKKLRGGKRKRKKLTFQQYLKERIASILSALKEMDELTRGLIEVISILFLGVSSTFLIAIFLKSFPATLICLIITLALVILRFDYWLWRHYKSDDEDKNL